MNISATRATLECIARLRADTMEGVRAIDESADPFYRVGYSEACIRFQESLKRELDVLIADFAPTSDLP